MTRPHLFPPEDLLRRVDGVEEGLRRGRRVGLVGWGAFALSAVSLTGSVLATLSSKNLPGPVDWSRWPIVVPMLAVALSLLLVNWTRFWVQSSREPFRYTYSIAPLEAVGPVAEEVTTTLGWLVQDLSERLSRRIGRLSLLDERYSGTTLQPDSHIHLGGSYGIRQVDDENSFVEVLPWVRLGPTGAPATVAHLVRFNLGKDPELSPEGYEKLLERIYFSIATHLYRQIRGDVENKVSLLPKRYYRASAYFYEAEDHARSNTLDAFEQASSLYMEVLRLYDPRSWSTLSSSPVRGMLQRLGASRLDLSLRWRRRLARVWPKLAQTELMVARAELGYAGTLLQRRLLAGMSGQRLNPIFDARPVIEQALGRLRALPDDTPGLGETRFDASVTLAQTFALLGSVADGWESLKCAQSLDPARAEQDARYLHVRGQLTGPRRAIQDLRRAVELDPGLEAAQFDLAIALEMVWRGRPTLEPDVAQTVQEGYEDVLILNPGNISAWANLGFTHWLLGDLPRAQQVFERGREYKEIKRETFVSELDYGLARIAAEQGEFEAAYRFYIAAVSARFSQGVSHDPAGYTEYQFERITRAIVDRFEDYLEDVRRRWQDLKRRSPDAPSPRVRDAVYAFVLNDYAEACFNYFLRSGNDRFLVLARQSLEEAAENLRARYALIHFNLHRIAVWSDAVDLERTSQHIERVVQLQPDWTDGQLERAVWYRELAERRRTEADRLDEEAAEQKAESQRKRAEADQLEVGMRGRLFHSRELENAELFAGAQHDWQQREDAQSGEQEHEVIVGGVPTRSDRQELPPARLDPQLGVQLAPARDESSAVTQLRDEADRFAERAAELQQASETNRSDAAHYEEEAAKSAARLLPHEALRTPDDRIDVDALRSNGRRWQREFDDLHVRALVMWCSTALRDDEEERFQLFEFVREHFWPDNFDVLTELRALCARDNPRRDEYGARLRNVIKGWINDEHAWSVLQWLRSDDLFTAAEAIELLRSVVHRPDQSLPDGLWLWIGQQLDELGDADLAMSCFRRICDSTDPALLFDLGKTLAEREDYTSSREVLRRAELLDAKRRDPTHAPGEYRLEIGRALWMHGLYREAVAEFTDAEGSDSGGWRDDLVQELIRERRVESAPSYRLLKNWLGATLTAGRRDDATRRDAAAALLRLTLQRYPQLVRRERDPAVGEELADVLKPGVTPIALEADESFFPQRGETREVLRMLEPERGDIASMRGRIHEAVGMEVPAVRILSTAGLGTGRYNVLLEGVTYATGALGGERRFCPDREAARRHGVSGRVAPNPLDGREGVWLPDDQPEPRGLVLWDRYEYMLRHLERVLLENLDLFVGVQELARAISRDPEAAAIVDESSLAGLAAVVQRLLWERVPIGDLASIANAFQASKEQAKDIVETAEEVRTRLAPRLPGIDGRRRFVTLTSDLEREIAEKVRQRDRKRFLTLPAADSDELARRLHERIHEHGRTPSAVVVQRRGLRPYVRRILAIDEPLIAVVALHELPEEQRPGVHGPIERAQ